MTVQQRTEVSEDPLTSHFLVNEGEGLTER